MQGTACDDDRYPDVKTGFTLYTDGPVNNLVWQAGSIDWCALNLYLGGEVEESLAEAETVIRHWREGLRDQWDIRDLTTGWNGDPWCNSHYTRHLMLWSIPLQGTACDDDRYPDVKPVIRAPERPWRFTLYRTLTGNNVCCYR